MSNVCFYLLQSNEDEQIADSTEQDAREMLHHIACQLITRAYRSGKKVLVLCETQDIAHKIDERLWQQEPDSFIPHNLFGEGPHYGAPVEIGWGYQNSKNRRQILINLADNAPNFAHAFAEVVDFVPFDEHAKGLARQRYRQYQQLGMQPATKPFDFAEPSKSTSML